MWNPFARKAPEAETKSLSGAASWFELITGVAPSAAGITVTAAEAMRVEADMVRSTTRINQALASTSTKIGSFAKTFAMGFAGGAVTAALAGLTSGLHQTVRGIAQVGDEAKRSGLSLQAFQEWKFVAEQNRIGIDALVDGFKELNLRADEFIVTGGGSASEAFMVSPRCFCGRVSM